MKKGFTMAELLITLMLVAVVVAITIPVITRAIATDQLRIKSTLYKSAFKTAESIVSDLTSDLNLYPTGNFYNASNSTYFCINFAAKLNIVGGTTPNCSSAGSIPDSPNFTTTNGMRWYGLYNTFSKSANPAIVSVDVDGLSKGQNASRDDILQILIYDQGRMTSPSGNETNYLQN